MAMHESATVADETKLVERARQGDQDALAEIVESHQQTVYNVALRMCGNVQDAEETLQETFLRAMKALPDFEGRSRLSTWLYRIASNLCLMQRRREASAPPIVSVEGETGEGGDFLLPENFVDWSYRPEDVLLDNELHAVMEEVIGQLPPALRIAFVWRDLEGLSTAETAQILNISESAVKVRLHRARLQLREVLSAYFAEHGAAYATDRDVDGSEEMHHG